MDIDPGVTALIAELGQRMGLNGLALDAEGACAIAFDGRSTVNIQYRPDADALWFYADLGVPASGEAVYGELLRGNFFWRTTLGGTLSLTGDNPARVVLARPVSWRGLDGPRLALTLETFVNTLEDWAELIAQPVAETAETAQASDDGVEMIRI